MSKTMCWAPREDKDQCDNILILKELTNPGGDEVLTGEKEEVMQTELQVLKMETSLSVGVVIKCFTARWTLSQTLR